MCIYRYIINAIKLIFDFPAHRKKYDEGCLAIKLIKNDNLLVTSGADGIIRIFQL